MYKVVTLTKTESHKIIESEKMSMADAEKLKAIMCRNYPYFLHEVWYKGSGCDDE